MDNAFNLYPLHVFRQIVLWGSITKAAKMLCVSQPAVSSQLRALEAGYQVMLFERTPRGMRLTPAGQMLSEYANRVFGLLEDARVAVVSVQDKIEGKVKIAASSTPGVYWLPGVLRRFCDRYPNVEPDIMIADSAQVLTWLHDYRISLAVVGEAQEDADILRVPVASDELRLVVTRGNSLLEQTFVQEHDLRTRTLFLREPGASTRAGAEGLLGPLLAAFRRVVAMPSTEAIKGSVAAGLGLAVLSSWATRLEEEAGLLCPIPDERLRQTRNFYLARRRDRPLIGVASALWDFIAVGDNAISRTA